MIAPSYWQGDWQNGRKTDNSKYLWYFGTLFVYIILECESYRNSAHAASRNIPQARLPEQV